ncbi:MAG: hypothetical protein IKW08_09030 [Roseburia sp.]|nr:hypothetical protein [Roseburia sp.]
MKYICQKDYLIKLKNDMLLQFSHQDICMVLEDIDQIFKDGSKDGKSEQEICHELGTPTELARMLKQDSHNNKLKVILSIFYILIGIAILRLNFHIYNTFNIFLGCVLVIVVPVYVWNLCGGRILFKLQQNPIVFDWKIKIMVIAMSIFVVMQQAVLILINVSNEIMDVNSKIELLGGMFYMSNAFLLILIGITLYTTYILYQGNLLAVSMLFFVMGGFFSSLSYTSYCARLDKIGGDIYLCLLPYILGGVFSLCFFLYIRKREEK